MDIKSRMEDINRFYNLLEVYNHGVSDGLLGGVNLYYQADKYTPQLRHIYTKGYEFGMSLWRKHDEEWIHISWMHVENSMKDTVLLHDPNEGGRTCLKKLT